MGTLAKLMWLRPEPQPAAAIQVLLPELIALLQRGNGNENDTGQGDPKLGLAQKSDHQDHSPSGVKIAP